MLEKKRNSCTDYVDVLGLRDTSVCVCEISTGSYPDVMVNEIKPFNGKVIPLVVVKVVDVGHRLEAETQQVGFTFASS